MLKLVVTGFSLVLPRSPWLLAPSCLQLMSPLSYGCCLHCPWQLPFSFRLLSQLFLNLDLMLLKHTHTLTPQNPLLPTFLTQPNLWLQIHTPPLPPPPQFISLILHLSMLMTGCNPSTITKARASRQWLVKGPRTQWCQHTVLLCLFLWSYHLTIRSNASLEDNLTLKEREWLVVCFQLLKNCPSTNECRDIVYTKYDI